MFVFQRNKVEIKVETVWHVSVTVGPVGGATTLRMIDGILLKLFVAASGTGCGINPFPYEHQHIHEKEGERVFISEGKNTAYSYLSQLGYCTLKKSAYVF